MKGDPINKTADNNIVNFISDAELEDIDEFLQFTEHITAIQ